jgi:hypothetical protein
MDRPHCTQFLDLDPTASAVTTARGLPQLPQNFISTGFVVPHDPHFIAYSLGTHDVAPGLSTLPWRAGRSIVEDHYDMMRASRSDLAREYLPN